MTAGQAQVPESRSVGAELVGRKQFRREALCLEELAHQPDCRPLVPPALNQHVDKMVVRLAGKRMFFVYTDEAVTIILVAASPHRSAILVLAVTAYPGRRRPALLD